VKQGARSERPKPPPTSELLLFLAPGADPNAVANDHGLVPKHPVAGAENVWVFSAKTPEAAGRARAAAAADRRVASSFLNRRIQRVKLWGPEDEPLFLPDTPPGNTGPGQWHLGNGASTFHAIP